MQRWHYLLKLASTVTSQMTPCTVHDINNKPCMQCNRIKYTSFSTLWKHHKILRENSWISCREYRLWDCFAFSQMHTRKGTHVYSGLCFPWVNSLNLLLTVANIDRFCWGCWKRGSRKFGRSVDKIRITQKCRSKVWRVLNKIMLWNRINDNKYWKYIINYSEVSVLQYKLLTGGWRFAAV